MASEVPVFQRIKNLLIGRSRNPQDSGIFHKISLIAFFAWIGLGADGLSSSCYGPQEAFLALNGHTYLSIFVALATVLTIFIISSSYSQIVELFPHGGGGYLVASKLLSPTVGMVSGCALLIDYVLTITVSIASGADAIFSLLPMHWHAYRLTFAMCIVLVLVLLNMRGVKESILVLTPIFLAFIATHVFIIIYAFFHHASAFPEVIASTKADFSASVSQLGFLGVAFLILRAYSMGAGTYTGIEAVSNGVPVLRDPKVQTAKRTMRYMAISLAFMVMGLMFCYIFYNITPEAGKTLNALLFQKVAGGWGGGGFGYAFILAALVSEAALLFVAAQTGFIDGPRVLGNMAVDRWFPTRFSMLSDRLVTQNGIVIMGGLSLVLMALSHGSVRFLIVLYSINVFLTFGLSQLGMVRHWWLGRAKLKGWLKKFMVNGIGLTLTTFILFSMLIFKFQEGGWITLLITGSLVLLAILVRRHYHGTLLLLRRLNTLVAAVESSSGSMLPGVSGGLKHATLNPKAKTACLVVNGFNGMGLHTLFGIIRLFGDTFKNFVFLEVGVVDAGNFKGVHEVENLESNVKNDMKRYVEFMQKNGFYAEGLSVVGVDVVEKINEIAPEILKRFPGAVFFGGQLIFPKDSFMLRFLHNYTVFALQKRLYRQGIPFVILPIRV